MKHKFSIEITFSFDLDIDEDELYSMAEAEEIDPEDVGWDKVLRAHIEDEPGEFIDTYGQWDASAVTVKEN